MSKSKKKDVQPKPKTEQQVLREFWAGYQALCQKHQSQLVVTPAWVARDDGSWSLVLQTSVGRLKTSCLPLPFTN